MGVYRQRYQLRAPQRRIFSCRARHRVIVAGRRFGKTYLALIMLICSALLFKRSKNWYVAPTRPMAKDIAWEELKALLDIDDTGAFENPLVREVSETELTVWFKNGSSVSLKGATEPDRLRGRGLKLVVLDEFADMDPQVWVVIRPQVGDAKLQDLYGEAGRVVFIGTPKGYNHFKELYDKVRTGQVAADQWEAFHFTTLEGGNIAANEIEAARADLTERDFRQEYMATFESIEGRVYHTFMRDWFEQNGRLNAGNLAEVNDLGGRTPILVGMDFNVNPMTATLSSKVRTERNGKALFEDWTWKEYVLSNSGTAEMMQAIRADFPDRHLVVFPDPTGAARSTKTGNVGETDHSIIQSFGADLYVPEFRTNSDKYNTVNGLMMNSLGIRRKLINPKTCPQLVKAYDGLTFKEGSNLADKSSGLDHITDADSYQILGAFPMAVNTVDIKTVQL